MDSAGLGRGDLRPDHDLQLRSGRRRRELTLDKVAEAGYSPREIDFTHHSVDEFYQPRSTNAHVACSKRSTQ